MFEQTAAVQESMNTEKIHYEAGYPPPPTAAVTNDDNNVVSSRCVNHPLFLTSSHLLFRHPPSTPPTSHYPSLCLPRCYLQPISDAGILGCGCGAVGSRKYKPNKTFSRQRSSKEAKIGPNNSTLK